MPVSFRLPPGFRKKEFEIRLARRPPDIWQGGLLERISMFLSDDAPSLERAKAPRESYYLEYTECRETIGGKPVVIQAYRMTGAPSSEGGQSSQYKIYATAQLAPRSYLHISGTAGSPERQRQLLAMVRTMHFPSP
ncbi:MAG: hypothetical protein GTO22_07755 [Gemmatimonadales bacterium]|nr:hypothetical protein [Gemmatimonadales bacterium]